MTHLSDDETVAKMGHPVLVERSGVGHASVPSDWLLKALGVEQKQRGRRGMSASLRVCAV
jgi:hypothetical protein